MARTRIGSWKWVFSLFLAYAILDTENNRKVIDMDALKWKINEEENKHHKTAAESLNRIVLKAELEKKAKAAGLWDYRNNKIVEA